MRCTDNIEIDIEIEFDSRDKIYIISIYIEVVCCVQVLTYKYLSISK